MSVPLRSRAPFFAFDAETGSRRPRWYVFLAGVLALFLAATALVAGVSAANAHTPKIAATCYELTVDLTSYNGTNTIYVEINGVVKTDQDFGNGFRQTYTFDDPTAVNTWTVRAIAHDDPKVTKGWSVVKENQKTTPCAAPDLELAGSVCNAVGGTTTLTGKISGLLGGQTYRGELFKEGSVIDTFTATDGTKTWPNLEAGVRYRLTVSSTSPEGLSKSVETFVVACPQNSQLQVSAQQCTVPDRSNGSVEVTATSVVPGRSYTAVVHKDGAPYAGATPTTFTPTAGQTSITFSIGSLPENVSGLTVVLTDVAAGTTTESAAFSMAPCPDTPAKPAVSLEQCTTVGGDLEITVSQSGLVPNRAYVVLIDDVQVDEFTASSTTEGGRTYAVTAGAHVVKIVDKAVPGIFAASDTVTVVACPTQPDVALTATECTVPGGSGSISVAFSGLGAGRSYHVSVTENGDARTDLAAVITATTTTSTSSLPGLTAGAVYVVTIVDAAATNVKDAATLTLTACPNTPTIAVEPRCEVLSDTTSYGVTLGQLEGGQQYTVTVTDDAGAAVVPPVTVTGGQGGSAPTFQVPNKAYYTFTVTNVATPAITATLANVYAATCDLPTFPLPPEFPDLPTLALTGAGDAAMPMLGALGLVQFGVALLALAAMTQFRAQRRAA